MVSSEGGWPKTAGLIISIVIVALLIRTGSMTGWMIYFGAVIAGVAILAVITLFDRSSLGMKGLALIMLIMVTALGIFMLRGSMSVPGMGHLPGVIPRGGFVGRILDRILDAFGTGLWWLLWVIFFPGMLLYVVVFGQSGIDRDFMAVPELLLIVGVTWLFWFWLVPRVLFRIGLWNPFRRGRVRARRPSFARMATRIGEWSERSRFGLGPTGGWAGLLEILSLGYRDGDVFLGRPKGYLRPVGIPTEKHMVTISQTGAGKSTAGLIPNLCLHKGAALVIDPKGELATVTRKRRGAGDRSEGVRGLGQDVHVVDPFGIVKGALTAVYNPFDELARMGKDDPRNAVAYAEKMSIALVSKLSEKDAYWDRASKTLVWGLIVMVYYMEPKENWDLGHVYDFLMVGDVETYEALVEAREISPKKNTPFGVLFKRMKDCRGEGYLGDFVAKCAWSVEEMAGNQMGSVLTNAQEHLSFLGIPHLREATAGQSSFLLSDLLTKKMTVYVCLPLNEMIGKGALWMRMFVLMFIDMVLRPGPVPEPPILLAIDEFPNLGYLEGIELVAPTLRSRGVRFWTVAQDIEQLEKVYPSAWGGFLGGAEAVQCMGITHRDTVKYISEALSAHVVMEWQDGYGGKGRSAPVVHPVLDPSQVSRILAKGLNNQIIIRGDRRPLLIKSCPYFEYMPWFYYSRDPHFGEAWRRAFWRRL